MSAITSHDVIMPPPGLAGNFGSNCCPGHSAPSDRTSKGEAQDLGRVEGRLATGNGRKRNPVPITQPGIASLPTSCHSMPFEAAKAGHDHVGIGSDFFGGPQGRGLEDASCFPGIFAELIRRKWSGRNLRKLASGNFVRVLREAERSAK
jgi:microsomal dipeptidase-like Zn-dependent dipeptidase